MEPRKEVKQPQKAPEVRRKEQKPKLQIVKLEERIAPRIALNHNETLVREPAEAKQQAPAVREEKQKLKLQIVKLEERIAPRRPGCDDWGCGMNHNETLVREPAEAKQQAPTDCKDTHKPKLQIVKLEDRIAPRRPGGCDDWGCGANHNETLVRDRSANAR